MANEVRLIDANALIEDITAAEENAGMGAVVAGTLRRYVNRRPTIDPESLRPKGRWELHGNDDDCGCSYFCSNCYRSYPEEWFYDHGQYVPFENCPHCTAKMEG